MYRTKVIKKLIVCVMCAVMLVCALPVHSFAADEQCIKVMAYNVSGIPVIGTYQGTKKIGGFDKSSALGKLINNTDYDIIGVQEDFNYHQGLADEMTLFPYQTYTSGGVPLGDGLNVFAKRPIYNVSRNSWEKSFGVLAGSTDRLAHKGFIYTVTELSDGVYVDVITLHTEAGQDRYSVYARKDNFRQLAEFINARPYERPLIVMGDFNTTISRQTSDDIYNSLILPAGLKDMWVELNNGGRYIYDENNWGGEAIDKVLYKSGGGVTFNPSTVELICPTDADGYTYTDHWAVCAKLNYTVNPNELPADNGELKAPEPFDANQRAWDQFKASCHALLLVVTHLYELFYLVFIQGGELFGYYPKY